MQVVNRKTILGSQRGQLIGQFTLVRHYRATHEYRNNQLPLAKRCNNFDAQVVRRIVQAPVTSLVRAGKPVSSNNWDEHGTLFDFLSHYV